MAWFALRPFCRALLYVSLPLVPGCFVYTEDLLDSDVVSFGGGASMSASQQNLKPAARNTDALDLQALPTAVSDDLASDGLRSDGVDAGCVDAGDASTSGDACAHNFE